MSEHTTERPTRWTIADRVVTAVLTAAQCAIFVVLMVPNFDATLDPTVVGAIFVGSGVVAIGGPIIIVVTVGVACWAFYRDTTMFSIPLAGILAMITIYVFPIILVIAVRS